MTPYSLARTIAAAVAQDAALQAWATDEFDKALTVYLGVPSADFPNLETDAPFVAPALHRGKRNEPLYVKYAAQRIAQIKGLLVEEVAEQTMRNAQELFRV